jgi:hypothetical protein
MNVARQQFPCVLGSILLYIGELSGLSFAIKRIGPPCCIFSTIVTRYPLRIILLQNYISLLLSALAENTFLKTACHYFCSSLGSILLLIESTMIDPLYLWAITGACHRCHARSGMIPVMASSKPASAMSRIKRDGSSSR